MCKTKTATEITGLLIYFQDLVSNNKNKWKWRPIWSYTEEIGWLASLENLLYPFDKWVKKNIGYRGYQPVNIKRVSSYFILGITGWYSIDWI